MEIIHNDKSNAFTFADLDEGEIFSFLNDEDAPCDCDSRDIFLNTDEDIFVCLPYGTVFNKDVYCGASLIIKMATLTVKD